MSTVRMSSESIYFSLRAPGGTVAKLPTPHELGDLQSMYAFLTKLRSSDDPDTPIMMTHGVSLKMSDVHAKTYQSDITLATAC